ncbi:MAG TPA: class IV adenylate cyclase [Gemmatimonadaceae bacterium]|nr:class IV adenylate cyclase [Gemmatimonadaceae bacterium]
MREVELKAVVPDEDALRRRLVAAGALPVFEGTLLDRRYDTAERALTQRDQVLRLRVQRAAGGERVVLEFKGAASVVDGYKVREEVGTAVDDAQTMALILESLGYRVTREVDRDIAVFALAGATVRLERYPRMDLLVEVEGEPAAIEAAIAALGIPRAAFTAEPLVAFLSRYEARTGRRAAICQRELANEFPFRADDA